MITRAAHDGPPGLLAAFTDGLHSADDPNFERRAIRDGDVPNLVQAIIQKHRWSGHTLAGTKAYIILPGGARP